jgi:peptidyl-prolyl cis-trans isomerase D
MLKIMRHGQRWITGLFIVTVGAVFVFYMGFGGGGRRTTQGTVVQVGRDSFDVREFSRVRASRESIFQEQLGAEFDARAMSDTIDGLAVQALIETAILRQEALDLGLSVAKPEIERSIASSSYFVGANGRFDRERFQEWANYEFGNQRNFIREQRGAMLSNKLLRILTQLSRVSDGEARTAVIHRLEEVQIAFLAFSSSEPPEDFAPEPAAVQAFLSTRELETRGLYEERSRLYNIPEQVRASHILRKAPPGASADEIGLVRIRAEQILERVRAGEDFAALAEELSEDPGSKAVGGDLGFFGRGQMVKEFEDAAFAAEPGGPGELVESGFGFHILRVMERRAAQNRSYEDVQQELALELMGREAARGANRARADEIAEAIRGGGRLEDIALDQGMTVTRSGRLRRREDGFVPSLGPSPEVMAAAFSLEPGQSSDRVFEVGDKLVLVQLIDRFSPDEAAVTLEIEPERVQLASRKQQNYVIAWINQRRDELESEGEINIDLNAVRGMR